MQKKTAKLRWIVVGLSMVSVLLLTVLVFWHPFFFPTGTPAVTHEELVDYALSLINTDRISSSNIQNVSLSLSRSIYAEN